MTKERITALSQDEPPSVQASKAKSKVPRLGQKDASTTSVKLRNVCVPSSNKQVPDKQVPGKQAPDKQVPDNKVSDIPAKSRFLPSGIQPRFKEPWRHEADEPQLPPRSKTTFCLKGLLKSMTYWDITSVIRGGSLSGLRWIPGTEVAFLSFVEEERAMSFYDHVQKNGLYIQEKKIHVSWASRPYRINNELTVQIRKGASRNLIIRGCEGKLTEREIRNDMEHIDKLVIIKVIFSDGHCHIKTNSIFDAMTTRTCMLSRRKYNQWVIQWDHDECSEPLEGPQESRSPKQKATSSKEPAARGHNRFASLGREDNDNSIDNDNLDN
ncbi:Negative regulator of differentiation 1 [Daldinia childiae]|uniref:Negative regulator of differentiation 1 n=1 Tax=Daldinia childiae TaxID=326645 RepID=UPI00144814E4|nr:Negative regulator of differentiation 1 [Daldinia childiae]KAF3059279.1 Negative regulator of differentiation 1 [Daldinia childiae]